MPNLILQGIDADEFRAEIVREVTESFEKLLSKQTQPSPQRCANRTEMAEILGWSLAKLDRRTAEGALETFFDEGKRSYRIEESLAKLQAATPEAEAKARERQAAKQAAKVAKRRNEKGGADHAK